MSASTHFTSATSDASSTSTLSTTTSGLPFTAHDMAPGGMSTPTSSGNAKHDRDEERSGLLNYYFLFIGLVIVFLLLGTYLLLKRKRRIKMARHNNGQTALARDLEGWRDPRGWRQRPWRTGVGGSFDRREEGLNEQGEAPPPYQPDPDDSQPTIPLRTLQREDVGLKPPDYNEIGTSQGSPGDMPPRSNEPRQEP